MLRRKVGIIGGGPVGLAAALFMEKMGISYALIERNKTLMSHPAAHLLNLRTMETLSELKCPHTQKQLNELVYEKCEDINYFRYYRYQKRLLDPRGAYYVDDHFAPDPQTKQKEILEKHAFARYVHLPQPHFVDVLKSCLKDAQSSVMLGHSVQTFTQDKNGVNLTVKNLESGVASEMQVDYLIACDGKHSAIRNSLGIGLVGNAYLQSFLNIYFHSKKLADTLNSAKENAMLHFIYNSDVIACLVNHSKSQGMFVMQIPSSPPYDDLSGLSKEEKDKKAKTIIMNMIDSTQRVGIDDIEVKSTGIWKLSSEVIEKYYQGRVIFAGDSAHAFPPAGGFGMNTGLQEVHCLAHKLQMIYSGNGSQKQEQHTRILDSYDSERKQFVTEILNTANKYYKVSLDIAKHLGLSVENYFSFKKAVDVAAPFLPPFLASKAWQIGIKVGSYPAELQDFEKAKRALSVPGNTVPLIFYKEDTEFKYDKGFVGKQQISSPSDIRLSGQLLPHIIISVGETKLALRQLPEYLSSKQNVESSELFNVAYSANSKNSEVASSQSITRFQMIALHQGALDHPAFTNFIDNLQDLYVKPDEIVSVRLSEKCAINSEDLKKLFSSENQIILVRSDAHIFGRYTLP